jgi:pyruvate dehydrogenase E2 component (dihydrolipoamide acetyltransferase)
MAKAIIMPKFGFTQETAQIVSWMKQEGEAVEAGDPIAEVTTDKVNMEVEAPEDGILAGLRYQEGDTVPVTEVIAYIIQPGESVPGDAPAPAAESQAKAPADSKTAEDKSARIKATPVAEQFAREKGIDLAQVTGSGPGGRITRSDLEGFVTEAAPAEGKVRATPAARRLAAELAVELDSIAGSGPRGRIQGEDVLSAAPAQKAESAPATQPAVVPVVQPAVTTGEAQVIPMDNMRRTIAQRLQRSAQDAPHIYLNADVDASALESLRKRGNAAVPEGQPRISVTALMLKMVAWTLRRNPWINSRLDNENIVLLPEIHIGVAVALETGLIVPVIRNVDQKPVTQLAQEMDELVKRARNNKLRPDDVSEGTFTISNLGMFGVDSFTAIINPPQTAILAVGRVRRMFVPDENDQPVVRPIMTLNLGADHRVVDGAIAARFLSDLRECIEHPELMAL